MLSRSLIFTALAIGCGYHTRHPGMHFVEDILSVRGVAMAPRGPAFDLGEREQLQFSECLPYISTAYGPTNPPDTVDICYIVVDGPTFGRLETELAAEGWVVWLAFKDEAWLSRGDHRMLDSEFDGTGLFGHWTRQDGFTYRRTTDWRATSDQGPERRWFCERRKEQVCSDVGYWKSHIDPRLPRDPEPIDDGGPG